MQRTIKFRAWHPEDKVMVYDLNSLGLFHGVLVTDDYEVMQFTSLKDKNGKDIYEGDVLRRDSNAMDIMKIEFYQGMFGWWQYEEDDSNIANMDFTVICGWEPEIRLEIIGNIYHNPELLEKP